MKHLKLKLITTLIKRDFENVNLKDVMYGLNHLKKCMRCQAIFELERFKIRAAAAEGKKKL